MSDPTSSMFPVFRRNGLEVLWLRGGLYLEWAGHGLLLDAPRGVAEVLAARASLHKVQAVVLTGGRLLSLDGLLGLLEALEADVDREGISLWFPLGEERTATLATAWMTGWQPASAVCLDGVMPGESLSCGPFVVSTCSVVRGEPRWRPAPTVERRPAMAVTVEVGGTTVVWIPGCAPGPSAHRLCRGADLVVAEVGVHPWPADAQRWRLTWEEAARMTAQVPEAWLVGDDGSWAVPPEFH